MAVRLTLLGNPRVLQMDRLLAHRHEHLASVRHFYAGAVYTRRCCRGRERCGAHNRSNLLYRSKPVVVDLIDYLRSVHVHVRRRGGLLLDTFSKRIASIVQDEQRARNGDAGAVSVRTSCHSSFSSFALGIATTFNFLPRLGAASGSALSPFDN